MIRKVSEFYNKPIYAVDGEVGKLYDFYFDDRSWQIRYLVVELGSWFKSKQVLISPVAFATFDGLHLKVQLTKEEICRCPDSDTDKPVKLQQKEQAETLYNMVQSFSGLSGGFGTAQFPVLPSVGDLKTDNRWNQHLRSSREIARYQICTEDVVQRKIEDVLFDDRFWIIRSMLIKPDGRTDHEARLLDTYVVDHIELVGEVVQLGCRNGHLMRCPKFDPSRHVNVSYEDFLDHFNTALKSA
jgi:hypothetical protein